MNNIILIGMPGAGKSTIGMELSDKLSLPWIDTDQLIEKKMGHRLSEYIHMIGVEEFKKLEQEILLHLNVQDSIISTGGSVIYSEAGMQHLKTLGKIFYLDVIYETIENRIAQNSNRGIVNSGGLDLRKLYNERIPMYNTWSDYIINANDKTIKEICSEIINHGYKI